MPESKLRINGKEHVAPTCHATTLLDYLREDLNLAGTKKGCDHGQCGACTVLIDGKRILSCLQLTALVSGDVTTIEGIARPNGDLHPVQAAFAEEHGFQCGYCTPGQIMSAVGLLNELPTASREEIQLNMSGNLCRCAAYPNIVDAVERARNLLESSQ